MRRTERRARQKVGHGHIVNPDAGGGECNLKGEPGRVSMKRDPASVQPSGQRFAVLSWVAPHSTPQRSRHIAVKIRGVFATVEEAKEHAAAVYRVDPDFDIHVVDMFEWLVIPPPMEHRMQIPMEYQQPKLDRIMRGYYEQIERQKSAHDRRVAKALADGQQKATEWRRDHGYDTSRSLTRRLDPEAPERAPMVERPGSSLADARNAPEQENVQQMANAREAAAREMEQHGGRTVQALDGAAQMRAALMQAVKGKQEPKETD